MAGTPENRPMIRKERAERAELTGEPLYDPEMSFYTSGNAVVIGIPSTARQILGIEPGQTQVVEVHREGIWIPRGDDAE